MLLPCRHRRSSSTFHSMLKGQQESTDGWMVISMRQLVRHTRPEDLHTRTVDEMMHGGKEHRRRTAFIKRCQTVQRLSYSVLSLNAKAMHA